MSNVITKRLGDIVNFKRGYDLPQSQRIDGAFPVISSSGISGFHSQFKCDGEGLITGRYGTLGVMHYFNGKYWPHNTTLYATTFYSNYPKYVYYLLKCLGNLKTSDKSTVPGINRNDLHEINIPYVQNKKEQKAIAKVLSDLDAKIELNMRINAELEAMAKTLYDYWFVQFDFPTSAEYAATAGKPSLQGKPYKSSGGKMVYNQELKREIPEGWEVKELKDFAKTGSGGTPLKSKKEYYEGGTIPWINSGEVNQAFIVNAQKFITEEGLKGSSAKLFVRGTILMAMYGATAGKVSFMDIEACTNQAICVINPHKEYYNTYLKYGLEDLYNYLVSLSSGSARDNLSQDKIKDLKFAFPDDELLKEYHKKVNPSMLKILVNMKQNQQLASLRDWLLPMLMNGQLTIRQAHGSAVKEAEEQVSELGSSAEMCRSMAAEPKVAYKTNNEI